MAGVFAEHGLDQVLFKGTNGILANNSRPDILITTDEGTHEKLRPRGYHASLGLGYMI